ncbi:unnamed protein product [Allacma fusca]|uniref:NADH dehydrogenase [ubiquinone] 1 alpha subcomplex subunit 4 n=4 Tax=Allacma fusca TaxID=39272 RepID=A0A8J2JJQ0_9HEXA|nr:unnamed protein product [Allacma fusca]
MFARIAYPMLPQLRRHPQYLMLHGMLALGTSMATVYGLRVAVKEPEITWNHHTNLEPWNEYANKQYKFLSAGRDYSAGCPAPKY